MAEVMEPPPPVSNKPGPRPPPAPAVNAARFVTIQLASTVTGLTEKAIRRKIERGIWAEGKHFRRRDGGIFIDLREYEKWLEQAPA